MSLVSFCTSWKHQKTRDLHGVLKEISDMVWANWRYLIQWKFAISSSQRSNHHSCFIKKAVFKNFAIFTEKHLYWSFFSIKLQTCRPATLLKDYFEEHLRTAGSIVRNVECVVIKIFAQRRIQNTVRYLRWSVLWK